MKILAIETTGKYGSAAVIGDDKAAYSIYSENEMNHLQDIISISDAALKQAGISKNELTHVAASIGPGSFTGIRIGVTTARTLAQMLGIPCIEVSSLDGMRDRAMEEARANGCSIVLATINARRHQTYAGVWKCKENFTSTDEECKESFTSADKECKEYFTLCEENQYIIEDLLDKIAEYGEKIYVIGDGIDAYGEIIAEKLEKCGYFLAKEDNRYQSAENIANIALNKARNNEILQYSELIPNYMRLSEAEQRLQEGKLSEKITKA